MASVNNFSVVLFDSVSHAMMAEKILKERNIPHKIIPVPKDISSDCGVCIRFDTDLCGEIDSALKGKVEVRDLRPLE